MLTVVGPDRTGLVEALAQQISNAGGNWEAAAPATHAAFLELTGNDRVGIVRDLARVLAAHGVNVEELESELHSAPLSGDALFTARAVLRVPAEHSLAVLREALEALGGELMVDLAASDE